MQTHQIPTKTKNFHNGKTIIKKFLNKYINELPKISLHTLCHTHASILIEEVGLPVEVSKQLGYSAVTINVYTHFFQKQEKNTTIKSIILSIKRRSERIFFMPLNLKKFSYHFVFSLKSLKIGSIYIYFLHKNKIL